MNLKPRIPRTSSWCIEGVIFDLDATLVNLGNFVDWNGAHKKVISEYLNCGCSKSMVERCSKMGLFNMLNLMFDELYSKYPKDKAEHIQGRVFSILATSEAKGISQCLLMPGVHHALRWLKSRGIVMGVATSNSQKVAEQILEKNGLQRFFDAVVGRAPRLMMKPYPDQLLVCFEMLDVDPYEGVVVGDSVRDVEAGKTAGAYTIAIPAYFTSRKTLEEAGADYIISSLKELPEVISCINLSHTRPKYMPRK
jgi:HAD superfamily hydrolase (TIGR01509 family)